MNRIFRNLLAGTVVSTILFASQVKAQNGCQEIANDVSAAIRKDPAKLLMVVEDALVINESCAGEIVKAAIAASNADAQLANQIGQTAISVAPKMSNVIADAVIAAMPGAGPQLVSAVPLDPKNPSKNPITPPPEGDDFERVAPVVRGVYLIQPPPTGIPPGDPRVCNCNPMSPSVAVNP